MKKILLSSTAFSISLFSQSGVTADLAIPVSLPPAQVAVATQDLRLSPPQARAAGVQFAAIGELQNRGGIGNLQDAKSGATDAVSGGLPSTPIALASLLLMICILIGRRNT